MLFAFSSDKQSLGHVVCDLTAAILKFAADLRLRSRMGQAARQHMERDFAWEVKSAKLVRIFPQLAMS